MGNKIIIGAGLYGLFAALFCAKQNDNVVVLEQHNNAFERATYINQARVHMGYHYPRSISTAFKSRRYFDKFVNDFGFCVASQFDQVYATSAHFSWTGAEQFEKFCVDADIRCERLPSERFFKPNMCDGAFLTTEYAYDAMILREYLLREIGQYKNCKIFYNSRVIAIEKMNNGFSLRLDNGEIHKAEFVLNATYASVNQIHEMLGYEPFKIKYELCELILCRVNDKLKGIGFTVMDGPFFSIMPFGKTEYHSLTSVTFTPHLTSYDSVPTFPCQKESNGHCSPQMLGNCNDCPAKPESAWPYMSNLARKYLKESFEFEYVSSLFSMKPILMASEIDDSRPTVIRKHSHDPIFISVLSGKINTVYDIEEVLKNDPAR